LLESVLRRLGIPHIADQCVATAGIADSRAPFAGVLCTYVGLRHGVPATCVLIPGVHRAIAFRVFEISPSVRKLA
jgi:hypothetical protein